MDSINFNVQSAPKWLKLSSIKNPRLCAALPWKISLLQILAESDLINKSYCLKATGNWSKDELAKCEEVNKRTFKFAIVKPNNTSFC